MVRALRARQRELEIQNEQLRRTERASAEACQRYRELYEMAPVGYLTLDGERRIREVNLKAAALLGHERADLLDKRLDQFAVESDRDACYLHFRRATTADAPNVSSELQLERPDGTRFWVLMETTVVPDGPAEPAGFRVTLTDISERKAAQEQLAHERERLQLALSGGEMGLWDRDLRTDEVYWSDELYALLGRGRPQPITGDTFFECIHPEDQPRVRRHAEQWLAAGGMFQDEFRIVRPTGEVRWLAARGRIVTDDQGRPLRATGVNYDISPHRQAEQARRESEQRFRTMADGLPLIVWVHGADGRQQFVNQAFYDYFDLDVADIEGQCWQDLVYEEDREAYVRAFEQSVTEQRPFNAQVRVRRGDGQIRWLESWAQPRRDETGGYGGMVGASADVTELKTAQEQRARHKDLLEQEVQDRTEQLHQMIVQLQAEVSQRQLAETMAHERAVRLEEANRELEHRAGQLRSLAVALSQAEEAERRQLAEILHDDLQQMLTGILFHLDIARHRAETPDMQQAFARLESLLQATVNKSRHLSHQLSPPMLEQHGLGAALGWLATAMGEQHGMQVRVEITDNAEPADESVKGFLFKATREMLLNVVKHAQVRQAKIGMWRRHDGIVLCVEDKGKGFAAPDLEAPGESGFGLFTIRERLELLDGRLEIESAPGQGCKVRLVVPDQGPVSAAAPRAEGPTHAPAPSVSVAGEPGAPDDKPQAAPSRPSDDRKWRVLLVDDHAVVREGLALLFDDQADLEVVAEAENGRRALELVEQHQPDVVVLDVCLPDMDGVKVTGQIKRRWPGMRVIGLSAYDDPFVRERMQLAGADAYLVKTGHAMQLLAAVRQPACG